MCIKCQKPLALEGQKDGILHPFAEWRREYEELLPAKVLTMLTDESRKASRKGYCIGGYYSGQGADGTSQTQLWTGCVYFR